MTLFKLRYARKCEMFILILCLKAKGGGNRERPLWSHAKMHKTELYCNIGHFIRWLLRLLESNSQEKVRFVLGGGWGFFIPRNKIRKKRPCLFVMTASSFEHLEFPKHLKDTADPKTCSASSLSNASILCALRAETVAILRWERKKETLSKAQRTRGFSSA